MQNAERYLERWQNAGLLDRETAARLRAFEAAEVRPARHQWQVLLALILGGILLGAGVLLFVAAHWDSVSPLARMGLVLGMLLFFHGLGLVTRERFAGLATAMHALGTVAAGAAIALTGQIFNMQEHWPAAVLLWAGCAGAGWYVLRDQFQQTLTLLLVPAWIACEFSYRIDPYTHADVYLARLGAMLGAAYLAAYLHSRRRAVFGILFGVGALLLPLSVGMLADGWAGVAWHDHFGFVPLFWRLTFFAVAALLAAAAFLLERQSIVPVALTFALAMALPWARTTLHNEGFNGHAYQTSGPSLLAYVMVAAAAVGLVAQGVRIGARALVNYGLAAFAFTVGWFYFSSVMDKLNRSLGLIALGVLFLGGGWALELTRRKLLRGMALEVRA